MRGNAQFRGAVRWAGAAGGARPAPLESSDKWGESIDRGGADGEAGRQSDIHRSTLDRTLQLCCYAAFLTPATPIP